MNQLAELQKSKPKDKVDEDLLADLARLEAEATIAQDDFVCSSFPRHEKMSELTSS